MASYATTEKFRCGIKRRPQGQTVDYSACRTGGTLQWQSYRSDNERTAYLEQTSYWCQWYVLNCLLRVLSRSDTIFSRPVTLAAHAFKPNVALPLDFLYLINNTDAYNYAFVVKDNFSGYTWITATKNANSEHVADTLARWERTFTALHCWVFDQGPHFSNEKLIIMPSTYNIQHKPTATYSP